MNIKFRNITLKLLFIFTILFSAVFLSLKVKAAPQTVLDKYKEKIDELLKRDDLISRFQGTSFMTSDQTYNLGSFNPNTDLGKVPLDQVKETPWYSVFKEAVARKILFESVNLNEAQAQLKELLTYEAKFAKKLTSTNLDDGHYYIPFKLYGVKNPIDAGGYSVYEKDDEYKKAETELLSGVNKEIDLGGGEVSKSNILAKIIGNRIVMNFIANKDTVKDIKGIKINPVNGLKPTFYVNKANGNNPASFDITLPLGLNASEIVFDVQYVNELGEEKWIKNVCVDLNYEKALRDNVSHEEDKKQLIEGMNYESYIKSRINNLRQRASALTFNLEYERTDDEDTLFNKAYANLVNHALDFSYDTTNLKEIQKDARVIYENEYRNTLKEMIVKKAMIFKDDIRFEKNAIYNHFKFTAESLTKYKEYLTKIKDTLKGKTIVELLEIDTKIDKAAHNIHVKPNYKPLEGLLEKAKQYKSSANYNFHDANGKACLALMNEIELLLDVIKKDKVTKKPVNVVSDAKDLVNALNKLTPYFGTPINEKNPYDDLTPPTPPVSNKKYSMEFEWKDVDKNHITKYDFANTLFKTIWYKNFVNKIVFEKKDDKIIAHFFFKPIIDSDGNVLFAIKQIQNKRNGSANLEIDEEYDLEMKFQSETKQIKSPKKAHFVLNKDDDENILTSITFYWSGSNTAADSKFTYTDCKFQYKLDTKEIIDESLNKKDAEKAISEFDKLDLTNIPNSLKTSANLAKTNLSDALNNPTTTQDGLNDLTKKLNDKIAEINKLLEFLKVYNEKLNKFNELKASNNYTDDSVAEFEQILNEAKDIFDNNKQDKIDEYTKKLNNILSILKQKQINYDIAKEAIKLHKDTYTVLPSLVNETYIQKYNELKQVIENENASSQEYLNRLVEIFKIEAAKCKNYLDLKNLYQLKLDDFNNKKASNKYSELSIAKAEIILNDVKVSLDENKADKFPELTDKLNNIESIYEFKKDIDLEDGEYTVNVSFRKNDASAELSHADEALNNRARMVVSGNKVTLYLRLQPTGVINGKANGVISDISFPDGTSVNVISSKNTTIEYAGQTYIYNYPTEVSFDIDIKKEYYITKLVSRSPAFGSNTHDEEARLYVDILNAVKGFNQDEPDKKDLIYHRNELNKVFGANQSILPDEIINSVNELLNKIKEQINSTTVSENEVKKSIKDAKKLITKILKFNDLEVKYKSQEQFIKDYKLDNEITDESKKKMSDKLTSLYAEIRNLISKIDANSEEDYNEINKKVIELGKIYLLARYNTSNLKALLDEFNNKATPEIREKYKAKISEITTYIELCKNTKPAEKPSKFETALKAILSEIKGENPSIPESDKNDLEVRFLYFLLAKTNLEGKKLNLDGSLKDDFNKVIVDQVNNQTNIDEINKLVEKLEKETVRLLEKEISISKSNSNTLSKLDSYLYEKKITVSENKNGNTFKIRFKKGYIKSVNFLNPSASTTLNESVEYDEFIVSLPGELKSEYELDVNIKAMNRWQKVNLKIK